MTRLKRASSTASRTSLVVAAAAIVGHLLGRGGGISTAYEWQNGGPASCPIGQAVTISSFLYGDWNLYTNYGWENGEYNIPYHQEVYAVAWSDHNSVSNIAAEAENYVDRVGADCIPK